MADYRETTAIAKEWQRCRTVTVSNPLGGTPAIMFEEERLVQMSDGVVRRATDGCGCSFSSTGTFLLRNPSTNEPTGAIMTHNDLYVALYSLYMQTAQERDAQLAAAT